MNWIQTFNLTFLLEKKRKKKPSFFQTKVSKSERCHDLGPGGIFAATAHVEARFLCYFHILFTSRTLYNSHEEFLAFEKIFPMEKSKAEEKKRKKEKGKKKTGPRESLRSSTLASKFRTKMSLSNQNLPYIINVKNGFPYFYAILDMNCYFESCLSIHCLFLSKFSSFSIFATDFSFAFDNFAHWCVIFLNAPLSDWDEKTKQNTHTQKNRVCNRFLVPASGNLGSSSLTPEGPVLPLVRGFKRRDNLLAWR